MQAEKHAIFNQILDEFVANGDREAALEKFHLLSTMHNQKVIGVIYRATEKNRIPGERNLRKSISTLETERSFAAEEDQGKGRSEFWDKIGLAYSGPDQTLPKDMLYMDGGLYVNCSDDLFLGVHAGPLDKGPSITIGSEEEPGLLTLAFPSKENLMQIISVLKDLADTMESNPCSSFTDV